MMMSFRIVILSWRGIPLLMRWSMMMRIFTSGRLISISWRFMIMPWMLFPMSWPITIITRATIWMMCVTSGWTWMTNIMTRTTAWMMSFRRISWTTKWQKNGEYLNFLHELENSLLQTVAVFLDDLSTLESVPHLNCLNMV